MGNVDPTLSTGLPGLDRILRGLMPGDNLVWQVRSIGDYLPFVEAAVAEALRRRKEVVYFRFAAHSAILPSTDGVKLCPLESERGFVAFIAEIHDQIERHRHRALYVFDCLSELAVGWNSDRMLGNFFMLVCPHLYDVGAMAYFALLGHNHSFHATRPISETTQILIDVHRHQGKLYVQPLKVQHRHSPTMYAVHAWEDPKFIPVRQSAALTEILEGVPWNRSESAGAHLGYWSSTFVRAAEIEADLNAGHSPPSDLEDFVEQLRRMMISHDERVLRLARQYLGLKEILQIRRRMIGTGLIGGKSVGLLLARTILTKQRPRWTEMLESHDSFFVGADVFCTYLVQNGVWWLQQRQHQPETLVEGAMQARQQMLTGTFPQYLLEQFAQMLDYFGQSPIIVRSSSLLEDAFGNAFAGKYDSVFCANQGSPEKRMQDFLSAVRTVYASTMREEALRYRAMRGLLTADEQMGLLIQRVSGAAYDSQFFPQAAGVGLSFNPYAWDKHIDPHAGVARIVFGLGTRAVDLLEDDYTRVVALNAPDRRPETDGDAVREYSQHKVDILDLEANQEISRPFEEVARDIEGVPLEMFATRDAEMERRAAEANIKGVFPWVLTFDRLLTETPFVGDMREMLHTLQDVYRVPVDVEYTLNFFEAGQYKINLLQCRPLQVKGLGTRTAAPDEIAPEDLILRSRGPIIGQSRVLTVERIVYVVPSRYGDLATYDRHAVARTLGRLAQAEEASNRVTLMLGPGRWGTSTPALGVPVSFTEIHTAEAICEIVAMRDDLIPDVSLGTHFFNELVELDILYLVLFPEREGFQLNGAFLERQPNRLLDLLPEEEEWKDVIRVIDWSQEMGGRLVLNADTVRQEVVCYRERAGS